MGFLKKLFKPVSKVLDKIVPNEIKPFLPYAAAFAPYMLPGNLAFGAGTGIMSNPMFARALASGGINALSQLSQEGNDGELNKMSLGLAALQGGMGADGAAKGFRGMKDTTRATDMPAMLGETGSNKLGMLSKVKNFGLEGLAKGSEFIGEAGSILRPGETAMTMSNVISAAGLPFSMGTDRKSVV